MKLEVNGEQIDLEAPVNVEELLSSLSIKTDGCVVAINNDIIAQDTWQEVQPSDGDSISVFQAIAGG